ncbi:hypothetical protein BV509_13730 [Rhodovulum sulfidophilum]|uniref:DNA gyrase inhibitor GyrI n=1 Tax=Rhodovulum visakhapatnamense TaxID=364297 RepID=A0A4R8FS68_9RHOB|nr:MULTISPECIES: GyrI-like domain-containing protein [Rhodovulum]MBL3568179.1 GyrI-like domain-containing protein [Rhodovulum visakhapatnamense]MBL3577518.1 GyrI-like domain-containing protein [Rhodovulum visakhapatnamense]OLS45290.1 hypothetical protein BV509_13730 [Rhodovulum sulfidophilum]TDX29245.1 DNA gyrase inhibitor GyrI [Rhodovulum visakhapatnamense]
MYPVEIRKMPPLTLFGLPHRGPYPGIGATFLKLGHLLDASGLSGQVVLRAGVYHDDPARVAPDRLRSHACCGFGAEIWVPLAFDRIVIEGGRSAVMTCSGPYSRLAAAWAWLYAEGLPSGESPAAAPPYEIYRSLYPAVPVERQLTEVVVPLTS